MNHIDFLKCVNWRFLYVLKLEFLNSIQLAQLVGNFVIKWERFRINLDFNITDLHLSSSF